MKKFLLALLTWFFLTACYANQDSKSKIEDYLGSYESMMTYCRERDIFIDNKSVSIKKRNWKYTINEKGILVLGKDGPFLSLKNDANGKTYLVYSNPKKPSDPLNQDEYRKCD